MIAELITGLVGFTDRVDYLDPSWVREGVLVVWGRGGRCPMFSHQTRSPKHPTALISSAHHTPTPLHCVR